MKEHFQSYRNGWSVMMDKSGYLWTVLVRDARGEVHDKVRCDEYRVAMEYWRAFRAIAKNA